MASSPVVVLCIIALYTVVYIAIDPNNAMPGGTEDLDEGQDPGDAPDDALSVIVDVVQKVWGVIVLLFNAMVFNVPGAPVYIQGPVAIMIIGSLSWSIATLIRGN